MVSMFLLVCIHGKGIMDQKPMQYADAPIQRGDHGILLASMEVEEHGRAGKAWYQYTALKKVNVVGLGKR